MECQNSCLVNKVNWKKKSNDKVKILSENLAPKIKQMGKDIFFSK